MLFSVGLFLVRLDSRTFEIMGRSCFFLSPQGEVLVRAALICLSCDLPATRKVCGFAGHSAAMGCSKCLKRFPSLLNKLDYSGYDRSMQSKLYCEANTKAEQNQVIKRYGVHYLATSLFWHCKVSCYWCHAQLLTGYSQACDSYLDWVWNSF